MLCGFQSTPLSIIFSISLTRIYGKPAMCQPSRVRHRDLNKVRNLPSRSEKFNKKWQLCKQTVIIIWNAAMEACSKCSDGERGKCRKMQQGEKAAFAWCGSSRRHRPGRHVFFTFCSSGSQNDLKVIPWNFMPSQLSCTLFRGALWSICCYDFWLIGKLVHGEDR